MVISGPTAQLEMEYVFMRDIYTRSCVAQLKNGAFRIRSSTGWVDKNIIPVDMIRWTVKSAPVTLRMISMFCIDRKVACGGRHGTESGDRECV